ncbi:MAG: hypothetical protein V1820_02255 [archaeon]
MPNCYGCASNRAKPDYRQVPERKGPYSNGNANSPYSWAGLELLQTESLNANIITTTGPKRNAGLADVANVFSINALFPEKTAIQTPVQPYVLTEETPVAQIQGVVTYSWPALEGAEKQAAEKSSRFARADYAGLIQ